MAGLLLGARVSRWPDKSVPEGTVAVTQLCQGAEDCGAVRFQCE